MDHVVDVRKVTRDKALENAQSLAITRAINNGAKPESVAIVEKLEIQLAYLKGEATRIQVKAVWETWLLVRKKVDSFR